MVARWWPDDGRHDGMHFVRVFEIFCESGARWPSDRGALRFAHVLLRLMQVCRFSYAFIVFYKVFNQLRNWGWFWRFGRVYVSFMVSFLRFRPARMLKKVTPPMQKWYFYTKVAIPCGRSSSFVAAWKAFCRPWMTCQLTTLHFARVFGGFWYNCVSWWLVKVSRLRFCSSFWCFFEGSMFASLFQCTFSCLRCFLEEQKVMCLWWFDVWRHQKVMCFCRFCQWNR